MSQLHLFNPGHETAVLQQNPTYTPSLTVQKMMVDLELLPIWYGEKGDLVWVKQPESLTYFDQLPFDIRPAIQPITEEIIKEKVSSVYSLHAVPWGISPQSIRLFDQLKEKTALNIAIPQWNKELFDLTGRQTAIRCLEKLKQRIPSMVFPTTPILFSEIHVLEEYIQVNPTIYLLKTPYSSSGRGLLKLEKGELNDKDKQWISGAIRKQGCISIEPFLNKTHDYGWEFYSDGKGKVFYKGIALFETNEKGAYKGNQLLSTEYIEKDICRRIGEGPYNSSLQTMTSILSEIYGNSYRGCLGVDILLYKDREGVEQLHPCVEINMRYTMGYVALKLQELVSSEVVGEFCVTYDLQADICNKKHEQMKKAYPLHIEDGKVRAGYLSLCPVTKETQYRAYILIG